jgi:hypothetical protein
VSRLDTDVLEVWQRPFAVAAEVQSRFSKAASYDVTTIRGVSAADWCTEEELRMNLRTCEAQRLSRM